ncbi:MAG TPA: phosphotransferase, partial [Vicinamibacterales bacterium]|nr:phosphotransferase [Vicinamibacterales bacterium]
MEVLVHLAPRFDTDTAAALAGELYGVVARAEPLPSERDQNFRLTQPDGTRYVLKIANAAEDPGVLDLQHQALSRAAATTLAVPRVVPARDGRTVVEVVGPGGLVHRVRLFTWVEGVELARVRPHDEGLLRSLGRRVAELDRALAGLEHPAMHRRLPWDLAQADWLAGELDRIPEPDLRDHAARAADRFARAVAPALARLRRALIHNDWNDWNAIVSPAVDAPREVIGVVDFGDLVRSHLVCDVAIAAAYASLGKPDPLAAAAAVVGGYHEVLPLEEAELALLFDLIELRLCVSVAMAARQRAMAPANAYLEISQPEVAAALRRLAAVPREWAHIRFRAACGFEPFPRAAAVRAWLAGARDRVAPLLGRPIEPERLVVLDLGAGSLELGDPDEARDPGRLARRLAARLADTGAAV